jgi:hypothetical protein
MPHTLAHRALFLYTQAINKAAGGGSSTPDADNKEEKK